MPLTNCRAVRNQDEHQALRACIPSRLLNLSGGNLAFMRVEPTGNERLTVRSDHDDYHISVEAGDDDGQPYWIIAARNRENAEHSEIVCMQLYNGIFRRQPAHVTVVFTEREPCHGNADSCGDRLAEFLTAHGQHSTATPVRYLAVYLNTPELKTAAKLDNGSVGGKRNEDRQGGRDAAKSFRG